MAGLPESIRDPVQLERLDDYLDRRNKRDQMLWRIGINLGLKISDLRHLKAGEVRASHVVIRTTKTGKFVRVPSKSQVEALAGARYRKP